MDAGLDYSAGTIPGRTIIADGYSFVIRYVDDPNIYFGTKHIDPGEYQDLRESNVGVWLVFETNTRDWCGGFVDGIANGHRALAGANWIGYDGLIFFAIDVHVSADDLPAAVEYIEGAIHVLGAERVGVYGFSEVIQACQRKGIGAAYWQAGHRPAEGSGVHIWQRNDGFVHVGGVECDVNLALLPIPGGEDLTPEESQMLRELHGEICAPNDPWTGGISNVENDGQADPDREQYKATQFVMRNNVEVHQAKLDIQDVLNALGSLQNELAQLKARLEP